jgi:lipoprotein-anchoring transpeptidase ErfK/SrfK
MVLTVRADYLRLGARQGRHMLGKRIIAICLTLITGSIAYSASAQDCDERFSRGCQGYSRPPPSPIFPWVPFQPREIAPNPPPASPGVLIRPGQIAPPFDPGLRRDYTTLYAQVDGEPFPIPAVKLSDIGAEYLRMAVNYSTNAAPGTIVIDPPNHFLYFVQGGGRAIRYGVGVGREGFGWSGVATIHDKQEWPDWYPPKEMIARQPELRRQMSELEGGLGMAGGLRNPLGSRAMYLWQGNKGTLYRIHGTVEPWTIGKSVSSGCIRMINQDVIDLYQRTTVGSKVAVFPSRL